VGTYPIPELRDRDDNPFLQEGKKLFSTDPEFVNLLSRTPGINSQPGEIDSSESIPGLHSLNTIRRSNWYRKIDQSDLSPTTVSVPFSTQINMKTYSVWEKL
jgi:hypothetical protein